VISLFWKFHRARFPRRLAVCGKTLFDGLVQGRFCGLGVWDRVDERQAVAVGMGTLIALTAEKNPAAIFVTRHQS
jgi:hypothetical protein